MSNSAFASFSSSASRPRSIFDRLNIPFYILAFDYRHSSSGIRVLHYLCHLLNEMGEEAYVLSPRVISPRLRTPQLTLAQLQAHYLAGQNPVTFYPEVVLNNPMNTPITARWLLNKPGRIRPEPIQYEAKDLIFYHENWCLPTGMSGTQMFILPVDHALFNNDNNPNDGQRVYECVYARRYLHEGKKTLLPEHQGLLSLDQEIKRSPEEIAAILRQAKVLYCYQPSALIREAVACGCPVILVASDYWKLAEDDTHRKIPGTAVYGEEKALERARQSLGEIYGLHAAEHENAWAMSRRLAETVYAAAQDLLTEGKPLINGIQTLWHYPASQRIQHLEYFTEAYLKTGLYFPDRFRFEEAIALFKSGQNPAVL